MRDNDLRSTNFFDVETHPKMTFTSTGVRADGETLVMEGDLTIRGVTKPVTLAVDINGFGPDPFGGTRAGFSAIAEINRTDFGVSFNAPVPGGVMVSERIQIEIEAEAVLRKEE
jgi:polyisoprenoid-binding protein YceI